MRSFLYFQWINFCSYLKAATQECALHLWHIIWRMVRVFEEAHIPFFKKILLIQSQRQ